MTREAFNKIRNGIEWAVHMKKAMHEYVKEHGTTEGFDPYAVKHPVHV